MNQPADPGAHLQREYQRAQQMLEEAYQAARADGYQPGSKQMRLLAEAESHYKYVRERRRSSPPPTAQMEISLPTALLAHQTR